MNPTFCLTGSSHTFTPLEGPLDQKPLQPLFEEMGHAFLAWGRLEYLVTTLVLHINKEAASKLLHDPDPVAKFSGMVRLLRKWLTKHPEFAHLSSPDDPKFFDALLAEANLRNELAHSLLESIDAKTGDFTMRRIKRDGPDTWSMTTTTYKAETSAYVGSQASLATRHFVEIAKLVFERDDDAQPHMQ